MKATIADDIDSDQAPESPDDILKLKRSSDTWLTFLVKLLREAAQIEHGLMVQYLYAAFSIGATESDAVKDQKLVHYCRNTVLTVAKEEMGHLITVQNVLRLLRAPLFLDRQRFPSQSKFLGFPFRLERLSRESLSCYIAAESPAGKIALPKGLQARLKDLCVAYWEAEEDIKNACGARIGTRAPERVGALYEAIMKLIADESLIPDSDFDSESYSAQASWSEWGKEHEVDVVSQGESPLPSKLLARVFVMQVGSRTQAIAALRQIADQGEAAAPSDESQEPSHFLRFVEIYDWFKRDRIPVRSVPLNPTTVPSGNSETTYISNELSRLWAKLFDLRYQLLLTYLAHTYRVLGGSNPTRPGARAGLLHRVFGEMYNLRTIAETLVRLPLADPSDKRRAGPPFGLPGTFRLPDTEKRFWQLHHCILVRSTKIADVLISNAPVGGDARRYLAALQQIDSRSMEWMKAF